MLSVPSQLPRTNYVIARVLMTGCPWYYEVYLTRRAWYISPAWNWAIHVLHSHRTGFQLSRPKGFRCFSINGKVYDTLLSRISSQCFIVTSFASKQGISPSIPPSRNIVLNIVIPRLQVMIDVEKSDSSNSESIMSYKITLIQIVANYRTLVIPLPRNHWLPVSRFYSVSLTDLAWARSCNVASCISLLSKFEHIVSRQLLLWLVPHTFHFQHSHTLLLYLYMMKNSIQLKSFMWIIYLILI